MDNEEKDKTNNENNNEINHNQPNLHKNNQINANMQNENQIKQPKVKKKKKHRFLKFLLIVILIIALVKVFHIIKDAYHKKKFDELVANNGLALPIEEIQLTKEELKADSNGDGMSNEDKIKYGLDILSSDTDGDGLSDYDEINVYHSDPKKYSTSGDILGDGYKVQKGYEINRYYGDSATLKTQNENITLTMDDAKDAEAYYKEYYGTVPSEYTLAMQPFRIYSFTGKIEVKIENPDYYEVISYDNINKKATKIEAQTSSNTISFYLLNDNPILIVYKNNLLEKLGSTINAKFDMKSNIDSEYILIEVPILNTFANVPIYIFQVNNLKFKNANNTILETRLNNKMGNDLKVSVSYINSLGAKVLELVFGRLEDQIASYDENSEAASSMRWFLIYKRMRGSTELENYLLSRKDSLEKPKMEQKPKTEQEPKKETKPEEKPAETKYEFEYKYENTKGTYYADSGFSVTKDAFNFENLTTTVSNRCLYGICSCNIEHI